MAGSEQRPTEDVEGHMPYRWSQDTEAVDEDQVADDTEGHAIKVRLGQDTEATDEDQVADDTEGHARYRQDAEAVDEDQAAGNDTEGHIKRIG